MNTPCEDNLPIISIVIPCRNEKKYIGACLDSILAQNYKHDKLDVIVVDGMSDDGTRDLVLEYSRRYAFIKLIDNARRITPVALNIGIKNARGQYVLILSSHSALSHNTVSTLAEKYSENDVDCIGGLIKTLPADKSVVANAVALALAHPFGVGKSHFRIGVSKERLVDTVPFGCYKKEVFGKIGMFDEELVRNQDDEFNLRLLNHGGKILLAPQIISKYYARGSLIKLWKMFYQYGYFKPLVAKKAGAMRTWRQMIPAFFISSLLVFSLYFIYDPSKWIYVTALTGLYLVMNMFVTARIAIKKGLSLLPVLPVVFSTLHLSYGIGYLKGIYDFLIAKKHKIGDIPITR